VRIFVQVLNVCIQWSTYLGVFLLSNKMRMVFCAHAHSATYSRGISAWGGAYDCNLQQLLLNTTVKYIIYHLIRVNNSLYELLKVNCFYKNIGILLKVKTRIKGRHFVTDFETSCVVVFFLDGSTYFIISYTHR